MPRLLYYKMRTRKLAALVWYLILIMIVVASGYSMFVYATEKPPVEEIEKARTKLAAAKGKMAGKYAGASLKDAEDYLSRQWKNGKGKIILSLFSGIIHVQPNWL
jgi:hypothetical protein